MLAVVNNGTHFLDEMQGALTRLGAEIALFPGNERLPDRLLAEFSGVVLTGGAVRMGELRDLDAVPLNNQILSLAETPILGICLGHQLVAHHFGSTIEPMPSPVDGEESIEILTGDPLFEGVPTVIAGRVSHYDSVTRLGEPLVRLARSESGEYEAIRHRSLFVYGLQFHPEVSGKHGLTILGNFLRLCRQTEAFAPPIGQVVSC
jgi:GMP synthase (glutamine-hydrolysing)